MHSRMAFLHGSLAVGPGGSQDHAAEPLGTQDHTGLCIGSLAVLDILDALAVKAEIGESDVPAVVGLFIPLVEGDHIVDELHVLICIDLIGIFRKIRHIEGQLCNGMNAVLVRQRSQALAEKQDYAFILMELRFNRTACF